MARTLSIKNGKLEIRVDRPPKIRMLDRDDFNKQMDSLNKKLAFVDDQLAEFEKQKTAIEAQLAELAPFVGQL